MRYLSTLLNNRDEMVLFANQSSLRLEQSHDIINNNTNRYERTRRAQQII